MWTLVYLSFCMTAIPSFYPSEGAYVHHHRRSRYEASDTNYVYETKYFTQKIDHFSFSLSGANASYQQRYLINASYWVKGAPIFFYTGNEGDITLFCNNTGFMWDIAPQFHAMIVFAEHRYYGKSLPFGKESYKKSSDLGYLTSEQALADFAVLITELRANNSYPPVVAFGGSYGGMLSAWLRIKYPHLVVGSIAASAPIWQFTGLVDCQKPFKIISKRMSTYSDACATNVKHSWAALTTIAKSPGGMSWLENTFHLCHPLKDLSELVNWLSSVWFDLAEVNYPYPAGFLQPLPAWPMKVTCDKLSTVHEDSKELLTAIATAVQVYYNYTGQRTCLDVTSDNDVSLGEKGWDYQSCTEMVMPMCSDNIEDVFPKQPWVLSEVIGNCKKTYGVTPLPFWIETQYGGKNITSSSNIVFSNGEYDPWSAGGVTEQLPSSSLLSFIIKDGAHHVDLRSSNPADTDSIKSTRQLETSTIKAWLTKS